MGRNKESKKQNDEASTPTECVCENQMWTYDGSQCVRGCDVEGSDDYILSADCCDTVFGAGFDCPVYNMCKGVTPPPSPVGIITAEPTMTMGSTPTVSTEVTGPPTKETRTRTTSEDEEP